MSTLCYLKISEDDWISGYHSVHESQVESTFHEPLARHQVVKGWFLVSSTKIRRLYGYATRILYQISISWCICATSTIGMLSSAWPGNLALLEASISNAPPVVLQGKLSRCKNMAKARIPQKLFVKTFFGIKNSVSDSFVNSRWEMAGILPRKSWIPN